jgi:hypothetical protein
MPTKPLHPSKQTTDDALAFAAEKSRRYIETIADRRVAPADESLAALSQFHEPFPDTPPTPPK